MVFLIAGIWYAARQAATLPTALEELHRVNEKYNSLRTYKDWGRVSYSYIMDLAENPGESRGFNLVFERPGRLKFEFVEGPSDGASAKRSVIWTTARGGYAEWSSWTPRETDRTSLSKGLEGSAGMLNAAQVNLKMLVPWALSIPRPTEIHQPHIAPSQLEGKEVYRIYGVLADGTVVSLWVDMASHLIYKYLRVVPTTLDGKSAGEITTIMLHPEANPSVSNADFRFSEPSGGGGRSHSRKRHKKHRRR